MCRRYVRKWKWLREREEEDGMLWLRKHEEPTWEETLKSAEIGLQRAIYRKMVEDGKIDTLLIKESDVVKACPKCGHYLTRDVEYPYDYDWENNDTKLTHYWECNECEYKESIN